MHSLLINVPLNKYPFSVVDGQRGGSLAISLSISFIVST